MLILHKYNTQVKIMWRNCALHFIIINSLLVSIYALKYLKKSRHYKFLQELLVFHFSSLRLYI
jgi:NADH:ubiquinone oxidoreductase subunit 5 (subunit L)/multisubunit Na+/H+ antiporter MnhA subunit